MSSVVDSGRDGLGISGTGLDKGSLGSEAVVPVDVKEEFAGQGC